MVLVRRSWCVTHDGGRYGNSLDHYHRLCRRHHRAPSVTGTEQPGGLHSHHAARHRWRVHRDADWADGRLVPARSGRRPHRRRDRCPDRSVHMEQAGCRTQNLRPGEPALAVAAPTTVLRILRFYNPRQTPSVRLVRTSGRRVTRRSTTTARVVPARPAMVTRLTSLR